MIGIKSQRVMRRSDADEQIVLSKVDHGFWFARLIRSVPNRRIAWEGMPAVSNSLLKP